MSKRPNNSRAPTAASEDLVERLKSAGNDAVLLREIVGSSDCVSIAAAFAALVASPSPKATNDVKRQKKTPNRPCPSTPNENFVEILLFADRDALDAMQLVCQFLLKFIRDREAKVLPLRSISQVNIGKCYRAPFILDHWLPVVEVVRDSNAGVRLRPDTVNQLVRYLRLAYCESVCIDLQWPLSVPDKLHPVAACGAIFGDLIVPSTTVNLLTVCVHDVSTSDALRAIEAFKPLSKVVVKVDDTVDWDRFDEAFFTSAAKCGVRSIKFESVPYAIIGINLLHALSFGFADQLAGGDRCISGVACRLDDDNVLAQLVKRASELNGRQHIDFKISINGLSWAIDPVGFEKYRKDERGWLIDDLDNGVTVKVVEFEPPEFEPSPIEIHVFSSA